MWSDSIEPHEPGHDLRTFERPRCLYAESVIVEFQQSEQSWRWASLPLAGRLEKQTKGRP